MDWRFLKIMKQNYYAHRGDLSWIIRERGFLQRSRLIDIAMGWTETDLLFPFTFCLPICCTYIALSAGHLVVCAEFLEGSNLPSRPLTRQNGCMRFGVARGTGPMIIISEPNLTYVLEEFFQHTYTFPTVSSPSPKLICFLYSSLIFGNCGKIRVQII
jgi:hypothetical protein